jgi:hypothetical protein
VRVRDRLDRVPFVESFDVHTVDRAAPDLNAGGTFTSTELLILYRQTTVAVSTDVRMEAELFGRDGTFECSETWIGYSMVALRVVMG